jgi:2-methylfumaryl-CoA isomerase
VTEDPDLSPDNPMMTLLHQPGIGTLPVPGLPVSFAALAREEARPAPRLGEHTEEILSGILGLDSGGIGRLVDQGVVGVS